MRATSFAALISLATAATAANFTLVKDYSGPTFFDDWDFYGDTTAGVNNTLWNGSHPFDDLTNGDVFYMGRANGSSLYSVDPTTGHAFIKVDNTTFVPDQQKRDSIRIASKDFYNLGTVWIVDVFRLPWGCSSWPSIWTSGVNWPNDGEIDIIEGINRRTFNQMALHTSGTCLAANGTDQTGTAGPADCSTLAGCTVVETKPNSYGLDFANNGGGVWATQFDASGIFIWFWNRTDIPPSITTATDSVDVSSWGPPSASWPTNPSCNTTDRFGPQQLIIDITLCGDWAGEPSNYADTCDFTPQQPVAANRCYADNVINNGTSDLATAYFEIGSIRAFSADTSNATTSASSVSAGATATASGGSSGTSTSSAPSGSTTTSGGSQLTLSREMASIVSAFAMFVAMLLL